MTIINAPARAFAARPFAAAETATPDPWFDAAAYAQLLGTSDNDLIRGGADDDEIGGLDGEDLLYGAAGDDLVEGGMGQDIVNGGSGHDRLYGNGIANDGGDGADIVIDRHGGSDMLYGQAGDDLLEVERRDLYSNIILMDGGAGNDRITLRTHGRFFDHVTALGGSGDDRITIEGVLTGMIDAGSGDDLVTIDPRFGDVTITLGDGADVLLLAGQSDGLLVGPTIHVTDFESGTDRIDLQALFWTSVPGWTRSDDPFDAGFLRLVQDGADTRLDIDQDGGGTAYDFQSLLTFDATLPSTLSAADFGMAVPGQVVLGVDRSYYNDDLLLAWGGTVEMRGLDGSDRIENRGGDGLLIGHTGRDSIVGGIGNDILYGDDPENPSVVYGAADTLIDSRGGNDQLFGQAWEDVLIVRRSGMMAASDIMMDGGHHSDLLLFDAVGRTLDSVTALGGNGEDRIEIGSVRRANIDAGSSSDRVHVTPSHGLVTVTLGSGADKLTLTPSSVPWSPGGLIHVTDFAIGTSLYTSDRVDLDTFLRDTLLGWNGLSNPFADGYLRLVQSGPDALLQLDRDGSAGSVHGYATLLAFDAFMASDLTAWQLGYDPAGLVAARAVDDGGTGNDRLTGSTGNDLIRGLDGNDTLMGSNGDDLFEGGAGADQITGGSGNDIMHGDSAGSDTGGGADRLYDRTSGDDRLFGQGGDDLLEVTRGNRYAVPDRLLLDGGIGADQINFRAVDPYHIVTALGGDGNDIILVDGAATGRIDAGAGNDRVTIGEGSDFRVTLGAGADRLSLEGNRNAPVVVTDFHLAEDSLVLDARAMGISLNSSQLFLDGRLALAQRGADTLVLQYDYAAARPFFVVLVLENVLATMLTSTDLGGMTPPDGLIFLPQSQADSLIGTTGDDRLYGLFGTHQLAGGSGDDLYLVDDAGDMVTEQAGEGTDVIHTNMMRYTLPDHVEQLTGTSQYKQWLTGNDLDNVIEGSDGETVIDGGLGADRMIGGWGGDVYMVDNVGDVIEDGYGMDAVRTTLPTYTLRGPIENLYGMLDSGQTLNGNQLDNRIAGGDGADILTGSFGDDILNGGRGADQIAGGPGDDILIVDHVADTVIELADEGSDTVRTALLTYTLPEHIEHLIGTRASSGQTLIGNAAYNEIIGTRGNDVIDGGGNNDRLRGREGADTFLFSTAPQAVGFDIILDFQLGEDRFALSQAAFADIGPIGTLDAGAFRLGNAAIDADDRILYDVASGLLAYDADGSGPTAARHVAQARDLFDLSAADIFIVA